MRFFTSHGCAVFSRLALAACCIIMPARGWATLGDNAGSVLNDQSHMKGTLRSVDNRAFVLHEITMPSGAKVREYVSPAGAVFGVAWEGQFPPDFRQLLGPYYEQVQHAMAQQSSAPQNGEQPTRRRRGPVMIETPGIVFVQTGHMRSFHGQAYIPQLVPQGVKAGDIR